MKIGSVTHWVYTGIHLGNGNFLMLDEAGCWIYTLHHNALYSYAENIIVP